MLGVAGLHQEGHQEKGRRKKGRPCLGWQDCIKRDIRRKEERKTMLGVAGLHQEGY